METVWDGISNHRRQGAYPQYILHLQSRLPYTGRGDPHHHMLHVNLHLGIVHPPHHVTQLRRDRYLQHHGLRCFHTPTCPVAAYTIELIWLWPKINAKPVAMHKCWYVKTLTPRFINTSWKIVKREQLTSCSIFVSLS